MPSTNNWPHLLSFLLLLICLLLLCSAASLICWLTFSSTNSPSSSFFSSSTSKSSNNSSTVPASQPQFLLQKLNQSKMDTASLSQNGAGELVANGVVAGHHQLNGISLTNGHSEQKDSGLKNGFHHPLMNGGYSNRLRNAYLNGNANGELTNGNVAHHNGHSKDAPNGFLPNSIPRSIRPHRRLRIAQVAPLYESVPPKMYGGTERVVAHLTEELVRRGHEVTLFCSADSQSSAKMVFHESWPAFRLNPVMDVAIPYQWMMEQIRRRANEFDILHFHTMEHFTIVNQFMNRSVTTLHGLLSFPDMKTLLKLFNSVPLVSISDDQRIHLKTNPNWVVTVHHGIPRNMFPFTERPQGEKPYLAFLGRITDVKRPEWAIQIAVKAGIPLRIAAKVDKVDVQHWEENVKPLIEENSHLVEYIGEINDSQKGAFLGNALALLFPIDWNEPFGLVMIESLACGTPVVARKCGSVPEVIDDGLTGIIFETIEEGIEAVKRVHQLDRAKVRETFERRFTSEKMAENYLNIYEKMLGDKMDDE